ncbi:MAG: ATP-binding protein [Siphonobacter sp.]
MTDPQYSKEFPEHLQMLNKINLLVPYVVYVQHLDTGELIYINDRVYDLIGYTSEELKTLGPAYLSTLLSQKSVDYHKKQLRKLRDQSSDFIEYEISVRDKNNSIRIVRARVTIFRWEAGKPIECIGIAEDVTEQRAPYHRLLQQQEMFTITEDVFHFGSWEKDMRTGRLTCSDGLYKILGYTKENFPVDSDEYTSLFEFLDEPNNALLSQAVQQSIEKKHSFQLEHNVLIQNGQEKILIIIGRPVTDESGKVILLVGSIADITILRNYESALRHKIEELQRSNGELEQFAYAASHDLQEPLRKISAFIGRLHQRLGSDLSEDIEDYIRRTLQAVDRMRTLIDGLLLLSRVTRQGQERGPVSLEIVLKEVIEDFDSKIAEKHADIQVGLMPIVEGVDVQVRQLFSNLLGNSLKFTDSSRSPVIRIQSRKLNASEIRPYGLRYQDKWVEVTVEDNGIGFDPQYSDRIFQVFQRLNGRSEYEGTGIGLALCKKIVENLGGIIEAQGKPGEGASFRIILRKQNA